MADISLPMRLRSQALQLLTGGTASRNQLNSLLRLFAKYRCRLIQNTMLKAHGTRVLMGPFAGMGLLEESSEGCHVPKLLGCYERELHSFIEAAITTGYDEIINIGCAEGYYAVGLAQRCTAARIHAYDTNPTAQKSCRELTICNSVAHQVTVAGTFAPETFNAFRGRRALFIIDVEGKELDLIETVPAATLADFDFIIECHNCFRSDISDRLLQRLSDHHALRLVKNQIGAVDLPSTFDRLGHLDRLLAIWEWRSGPTPWLLAASRRWRDCAFFRAVIAKGPPTTLPDQ